jgi:hypothetical protein
VLHEERETSDVVLMAVGDDQQVDPDRGRVVSKHRAELLGDRRVATRADLIAGVGAVDQDACWAELAEDAVAIFLLANVEEVDADTVTASPVRD